MKAQVAAPVTVNCFLLLAAVVVKPQKVLLAGNLLNFIVTKFFFMTEIRPMLPEHWEDVKKIYEEGICHRQCNVSNICAFMGGMEQFASTVMQVNCS